MARERKFTLIELFQACKIILLNHGYDGFTFSVLAEHLGVSRGTIYKYFDNKDELITEFMIYELNVFLSEIKDIESNHTFEEQFDFLLEKIFSRMNVYYFIGIGKQIDGKNNQKVKANKEKLAQLHLEMYSRLQDFIRLGKSEKILNSKIPDSLILGYIFQSIALPNHFNVPQDEWNTSLKELIKYGMFNR